MTIALWAIASVAGLFVYLVIGQAVCRLLIGQPYEINPIILAIWPFSLVICGIIEGTLRLWWAAATTGDWIAAKLRRHSH